jgi:aryl-alcohol dehydrogenase-like predicted oxidoreductase
MHKGFASAVGTARFRDRFPQLRDAGHFRHPEGVPEAGDLWISSLGLGTYLGDPTDAADAHYEDAITAALRSGINLLDTAINYRHQRSERNIGAALERLINAGTIARDEVVICTKAGFLSFDGGMPPDPRAYFAREYIEPGILDPAELSGGMHCMAPQYLANQIERSRRNLRIETIDVFYVHNPEAQLADVNPAVFRERLKRAFTMLESAVADGRISFYGTATWNGYRVASGQRDFLDLADVVAVAKEAAKEAGGDGHHFRFIQLPFNLAMPEAFALKNQRSPDGPVSTLELARREGIGVVGSATLYQGRLAQNLPDFVAQTLGMESDAENAIQFSRSAPGLTTALIGMAQKEHVARNVKVATHPLTASDKWTQLFRRVE